ncbi:MAG: TIGR03087 family PEP-CTERM/XrtA system glycosyltransferase [Magnetococcales bacterium]|nr:TIGR03087 family PEP-CTERM/XrtA system glycosyltransferase [Magnetococcales bacterium]
MEDLLFLSHRIPYPPNKGDKVRSYHLLRFLARHYRVHVGAFIDTPEDWVHAPVLQELCHGETHWATLNPRWAKVKALRGLWRDQSLTFHYYANRGMQHWVNDLMGRLKVPRILVYSAAPSRFVMQPWSHQPRCVIDFVDVDSAKWLEYARSSRGIMSRIHARESRTLQEMERAIASRFAASLFVSHAEAELFRQVAPESADRVHYWENGVDSEFFNPLEAYPNPYGSGETLVFTGAMDYRPNIQGVVWFAERIFSRIRQKLPTARFAIVGARPNRAVKRLATQEGIEVVGAVADVRPYLAHARAAVAPLMIARGVQNKVLEAMAMAKPVIATPQAMEGIRYHPGLHNWVTEKPELFAHYALKLLDPLEGVQKAAEYGQMGRQFILDHYQWETNLQKVLGILEP